MMSMDAAAARRNDLYGYKRKLESDAIKQTLQQTNVLQEGEYNFDIQKEKEGVWQTWTKNDYRGARPKTADKPVANAVGHLKTHFLLGKHDEDNTYKLSRTKEDFITLPSTKPHVRDEDRTVNWPDMSPQYTVDRKMGSTEYSNTFLVANLQPSTPGFPKLSVSRLTTPAVEVSPLATNINTSVNVCLGSDTQNFRSEAHNSYEPPDFSIVGGNNANDISTHMKKLARKSNVFRAGDYNDQKQEPGSMFTLDYCKKLYTPSTFGIAPQSTHNTISQETSPAQMPQMIGRFLKEDHKNVLKDASDGRHDHTNAHFHLGSDLDPAKSVYTKDFLQNTIPHAASGHHKFYPAPPGSQVLQFDPDQRLIGKTSSTDVNVQGTFSAGSVNTELKGVSQYNMNRRLGNNIVFSCDEDRHKSDRLNSLSHQSFIPPPNDFKSMRPKTTPKPMYNYITTNQALPFNVNKEKESEAQNQYRSISMDAASSRNRQIGNLDMTKSRKDWGLSTHFTNGYQAPSFNTEQQILFSGNRNKFNEQPAAGKTHKVSESVFTHFDISENTQDVNPNPHRVDIMAPVSLQAQAKSRSVPALPVHNASIMTNDYQALEHRNYTPAQLMVMRQNELLNRKPIEKSHFFHVDNTGGKNFQSTAMADFVKPEMAGSPRYMTRVN